MYDDILEYNPDKEDWITRSEKIAVPRKKFGTVLVDDTIIKCKKN